MAENVYEGMFILDSNRYARDPSGVPKQIGKLVEDVGGELIVSRLWEERRLAYRIKGHAKGVYWLTYFRMEGEKLQSLSRQSEINEIILRHLFLSIDPKIVDAIVAHASGTAETDTEQEVKETPTTAGAGNEMAPAGPAPAPSGATGT